MTMMVDEKTEQEYYFKREDFAYPQSWDKYRKGLSLKPYDFVSPEKYMQHFLILFELVNYAVIVVSGQKRSGKSLLLTKMGQWLRDWFGKGVTMNFRPKDEFGEYDYLTEQTFIEEWVKLTELADRQDANQLINELTKLTQFSKFYNRFIAIDEARKWVWRRKPTARLLGYCGELVDLSGHNHLVIAFACPNAEMVVDEVTIWENRTHEVYVGFGTVYSGYATYTIKHRNSGRMGQFHINAAENAHLWETHNLISMSRPISRKQMEEALNKVRYYKDMEKKPQRNIVKVNTDTGEIYGDNP